MSEITSISGVRRIVTIGPCILLLGDCQEILPTLGKVDAVVTDPPYGLSFMGKKWDYDVPSEVIWRGCLSVLKPGGHLLAFAGTRTQHRMAVRIEDAGFEIRDMIAWVYGTGFPKSHDAGKAIDAQLLTGGSSPKNLRKRAMGEQYEAHRLAGTADFGTSRGGGFGADESRDRTKDKDLSTQVAKQWAGWGTALKPALEPITVARKPLEGTIAANVLAHGTGAINVDGCRVGENPGYKYAADRNGTTFHGQQGKRIKQTAEKKGSDFIESTKGRFPANLIHDGSEEVAGFLGPADRFFYCAKVSRSERGNGNTHPTVKPIDLMRYLCRLVTPANGIVLDPFMGSGSTAIAAAQEGFSFIGIEIDEKYFNTACARVASALGEEPLE